MPGAGLVAPYLPVTIVAAIAANVLATVSLVVRFRRARGVERQQLRWVVLGTVVGAWLSLVHAIFMLRPRTRPPGQPAQGPDLGTSRTHGWLLLRVRKVME